MRKLDKALSNISDSVGIHVSSRIGIPLTSPMKEIQLLTTVYMAIRTNLKIRRKTSRQVKGEIKKLVNYRKLQMNL